MMAGGARSVLVTGAADGIGLGIATRFARAGDRVALLDYDGPRLEAAVAALAGEGREVFGQATDVRDSESVQSAVDWTVSRFGRLDVAVSNAGVYPNRPVVEMEEDEWDRVLDTNLKGTFLFTRAVARQMLAQGGPYPWTNSRGKIVTLASGAHRSARIGAAHYCASKAGLVLFSQALAMELAEHGINVNILSPGFTDVGDRPGVSAEYRATITKGIPWGRVGGPDDLARAAFFLCSEEAEYMTGALMPVDGGSSSGRFFLPRSQQ
jgi:NAD(P)-dependent dehydrogenase (short-subunit alcohol dehydrogenase family)